MTATLAVLLRQADLPLLEARLLAAHALNVDRAWLIGHDRDVLTPDQVNAVESLYARRRAGEPMAYILGVKEFYGRDFRVGPGVLIPRPETELLLELALERLPPEEPRQVLDVGTGSGVLAVCLALERPLGQVTACDLSRDALALARENGARLGAAPEWLESDVYAALPGRRFHLIVSNPPYIAAADPHLGQGDLRFEPPQALASGGDGLEVIRRLVAQAPAHLLPGGGLLLEHGYDQAEAVRALLAQAGFAEIFSARDLAGHERVSGGCLPPAPGPTGALPHL